MNLFSLSMLYFLCLLCYSALIGGLLLKHFFLFSGWYNHVSSHNGCPPKKGNHRRVLPLQASDSGGVVG